MSSRPTVLVTRAAVDAEPLCRALRDAGLEPISVPLLERVFHLEAVTEAAARVHDGWVLTSPAAVEALDRAGVRARPAWIAAVGPSTARAAERAGFPVDLVPPRATAAALARALGERSGQTVLYPRADLASKDSLAALEATGAAVDDVVAYSNVEPEGAGRALRAVWPAERVVLLSGSAARRLVAHVPPPWPGVFVAVIGPSTARVCAELGLTVHAVAEPHTVAGVVAAVAG